MTPEDISKLAHRLYPYIMRSPDLKAGESLAERIETIQRGLMPEENSRRFEEALKQARQEPITKPTRDFDLD